MHEIDDFDYYVIPDKTEFVLNDDFVSNPNDLSDKYADIFEEKNAWLDNIGWL